MLVPPLLSPAPPCCHLALGRRPLVKSRAYYYKPGWCGVNHRPTDRSSHDEGVYLAYITIQLLSKELFCPDPNTHLSFRSHWRVGARRVRWYPRVTSASSSSTVQRMALRAGVRLSAVED